MYPGLKTGIKQSVFINTLLCVCRQESLGNVMCRQVIGQRTAEKEMLMILIQVKYQFKHQKGTMTYKGKGAKGGRRQRNKQVMRHFRPVRQ